MISSVYANEFNLEDLEKQVLIPIKEIYSKFGTKEVAIKYCQDKLGNFFFIIFRDRDYFLDFDAYSLENVNGNLIKHCIGSLQATEGQDIINGKFGSCFYISNLYATNKNLHIGSNLVNFVKEIAKKKEINFISLTSLPASLPFYQKLGFENYIDLNLTKNKFRLFYDCNNTFKKDKLNKILNYEDLEK